MSNFKTCFQTKSLGHKPSMAIFLFRLIMGVAFILHGWGKIQSPFGWMGPDAPVPGFLQFLAALSEFGGGLSLLLGLLFPLGALGIFCVMSVAVYMHAFVWGQPFVNMTGGPSYELALVFWGACVVFFNLGPGKFSLDAKLFGEKS